MTRENFNALMPFICIDFIKTISLAQGISEKEAMDVLYTSKLYELLADEETKIWHYSTPMLYSLLEQEFNTGKIDFPDV